MKYNEIEIVLGLASNELYLHNHNNDFTYMDLIKTDQLLSEWEEVEK